MSVDNRPTSTEATKTIGPFKMVNIASNKHQLKPLKEVIKNYIVTHQAEIKTLEMNIKELKEEIVKLENNKEISDKEYIGKITELNEKYDNAENTIHKLEDDIKNHKESIEKLKSDQIILISDYDIKINNLNKKNDDADKKIKELEDNDKNQIGRASCRERESSPV